MGPLRKQFEQIKQDIKALERVSELCEGQMNSVQTQVMEKLGSQWADLVSNVGETRLKYISSKRRAESLRELFNDGFFTAHDRDLLADLRDKAQEEFKLRERIWNEL